MTTKTKKTTIESTTEELRALMKDAETLLEKSGDSADEKVIELRERLSDIRTSNIPRKLVGRHQARIRHAMSPLPWLTPCGALSRL